MERDLYMNALDKTSGIPYYIQLKEIIQKDIDNNKFRNGKLPSENEFFNNYNVTVSTIRRALHELKNEGKIKVIKGVGYFIKKPRIDFDISRFISLGKELKEIGIKEKIVVKKKEVIDDGKRILRGYSFPGVDSKLIFLERIRYINDEPFAYEKIYLSYKLCAPILKEDCDFIIYDYITDKLKIIITRTDEYIEPINLNKKESEILNIKKGVASFQVVKTFYDNYENCIDLRKIILRGDKCRFHLKI